MNTEKRANENGLEPREYITPLCTWFPNVIFEYRIKIMFFLIEIKPF